MMNCFSGAWIIKSRQNLLYLFVIIKDISLLGCYTCTKCKQKERDISRQTVNCIFLNSENFVVYCE